MGKIARPHLPQVFPRRRLFGILDRMREHPLIYFSGPGGCGKTTLVNSYLEARNVPCLWYQIDEGDKDPATFFYYLSRAAKIASFKKKTFLPVFSPDFLPRLPVFTRWYFEKLFFSINHPPASPKNGEDHRDFILVFDNFHEVPANSLLPEIICEGLSQIPERTRFFILSRTDPPSSLSRLRANGQMKLIDWADLRLDLTETEGIIRLWNFRVESAEAVRRLHETSDGWTAGLILMLQKAQRARAAPELLEKLGREEIFDYFVGEIFRRADPAYQDFLLQTALFPRMTAAMAEEMTGLSSCEQILSTLCKNNFFTEKRLEKDPLYQYHPLFREFLISRIRKSFSLKNLRESTRRASSCLEKNGHFEDAIRLLLESKDFEIALPLVLKQAPVLNAQGRHLLLEEWVRAFPQEIQENQPWLLYWLGVCKYLPSLSLAKTYFEKAFVGFGGKMISMESCSPRADFLPLSSMRD